MYFFLRLRTYVGSEPKKIISCCFKNWGFAWQVVHVMYGKMLHCGSCCLVLNHKRFGQQQRCRMITPCMSSQCDAHGCSHNNTFARVRAAPRPTEWSLGSLVQGFKCLISGFCFHQLPWFKKSTSKAKIIALSSYFSCFNSKLAPLVYSGD